MSNTYDKQDPTFSKEGNAAVGQFYSSGGTNDSTGREPFEDTSRDFIHGQGTGASTGTGLTSGVGHHTSSNTHTSGAGIGSGLTGQQQPGEHHHDHHAPGTGLASAGGGSHVGHAAPAQSSAIPDSGRNTSSSHNIEEGRGLASNHAGEHTHTKGFMSGGNYADETNVHHGQTQGLQAGTGLHSTGDQNAGLLNKLTGSHNASSTTTGTSHSHPHTATTGTGIASTIGSNTGSNTSHTGLHTGRHEVGVEQEKGRGLLGKDFNNNPGLSSTERTQGLGSSGRSHGCSVPGCVVPEHGHGCTTNDCKVDSHGHYGSNSSASNYLSETGRGGLSTGSSGVTHSTGGGNPNLSSGAANTDKFDSKHGDGVASGTTYGGEYGNPSGQKSTTNQNPGRHGDDFTGGFAATGGAYTNPNAKTGLTGRETTATGVQDQHGEATQSTGLLAKVKNAIGIHNNESNA